MAHTGSTDPRYSSRRWRRLRDQVIRRDGPHCPVPGCTTDLTRPGLLHADHIHEVEDGGAFWDPTNVQLLCRYHHSAKTLDQYARRHGGGITSPNA